MGPQAKPGNQLVVISEKCRFSTEKAVRFGHGLWNCHFRWVKIMNSRWLGNFNLPRARRRPRISFVIRSKSLLGPMIGPIFLYGIDRDADWEWSSMEDEVHLSQVVCRLVELDSILESWSGKCDKRATKSNWKCARAYNQRISNVECFRVDRRNSLKR